MSKTYFNFYNYFYILSIFYVFKKPLYFAYCIISKTVPEKIEVRTPIGIKILYLRNFESLKTIFSIFCRKDYKIDREIRYFIDIGANCGYSAIYFLSQNSKNFILCYEPEKENLRFLKINLAPFKDRSKINNKAVGTKSGKEILYLSDDGKYNSLIKSDFAKSYEVEIISIKKILDEKKHIRNLNLKIDIEGLETQVIRFVDFNDYPNIKRIIIESTECSKIIKKKHTKKLRNGYIEHISFQ